MSADNAPITHVGITRTKLADIRERIASARLVLRDLAAIEAAIVAACPHTDEQGHPAVDKCWSEPGNGWCQVCLQGFAIDDEKRPIGPWGSVRQ